MAIWRIPFPHGASLRGAAVYGALNFGIGYALPYYGLQDAPAGTGAVVLATVPLFTLVLVALHGLEPFRARGLVGGLVALAGIALVFREQLSASVPLLSLVAILANALVAAESGVIAKGLPRMHPIATNAVGMFVGALIVLVLSFAVGEKRVTPHEHDVDRCGLPVRRRLDRAVRAFPRDAATLDRLRIVLCPRRHAARRRRARRRPSRRNDHADLPRWRRSGGCGRLRRSPQWH